MKKKGFTLVELLAVIVILAIIAVIATPMILNVIDNAKKGAAESSAYGYIDAVEKSILEEELKGNIIDKNKVYNVSDLTFVNIKGDKPSTGWIELEKGIVKDYSLKIGNYIVNNEDGQAKAEKGDTVEEKPDGSISETPKVAICTAATTKSIDSAKLASDGEPYAYGVEYNCNPGDGITRTFFVLEENGDNISLIMNENIGDKVAWCANPSDDSCNADGATSYLQSQTNEWINVTVTLPTYAQLYNINNSVDLTSTPWLYMNLGSQAFGYWTSTVSEYANHAKIANREQKLDNFIITSTTDCGVRPVITVSKGDIS